LLTLLQTTVALLTCYLYKLWFFGDPFTFKGFFYFYKIAFTVALFPIVIVVLLRYIYHLRKNQTAAAQINDHFNKNSNQEKLIATKEILLTAENGKDSFGLQIEDLCYIQSADNYAEIFYLKNKEQKKEILRNSLQRLEDQIHTQIKDSNIIRCHRSFLVNLDQVRSISGNAQGYKLHLDLCEDPIPVSRSKSKEVLGRIKEIK